MRALLQRVSSASVRVGGETVASIDRGLLALVGVEGADGAPDVEYLAKRILAARLFEAPADGKPWSASAASLGLPILLVSQFTLHANCRKPKPDFHRAARAEDARALFERLVAAMRAAHGPDRVRTGVFQAMMAVSLVNEGPVTVLIDSRNRDDMYPGEAAAVAGSAAVATADGGSTASGGSGDDNGPAAEGGSRVSSDRVSVSGVGGDPS
jgi:D-tyrosyl-tRNA(Tyr) deacylase